MANGRPSSLYLTKSAFKVGRSCPTKLYYYRAGYPSLLQEDPYLKFLADGGHIVGKLAQILFPDGVMIDSRKGLDSAVEQTANELKKPHVTLFEAALRHENKLVLVDVLQKIGSSIKLIEVKSKSFDSDVESNHREKGKRTTFINTKKQVESKWMSYLEDVCYQTYVGTLAFPKLEFIPYLYLPDKAKTSSVDNLFSLFTINEATDPKLGHRSLEVIFSGDAEAIRTSHFMTLVNVEYEVKLLWNEVVESATVLNQSLSPTLQKIETPISRHCSDCEYNSSVTEKNGYLECWGSLGKTAPHIFDLYFGTTIEGGELFDSLISQRKVSLFDIPLESLTKVRGIRQSVQIEGTRSGKEWFSDELRSLLKSAEYPLHFIDFETSRVAVPYHAGMRPFEQIAFQWSCHTIKQPGDTPEHAEWINIENAYPNFEFARSLRDQIGDRGTVLTWAHHESTVLNDICEQMTKYNRENSNLRTWIENLTAEEDGRILDLNMVTLKNYFHPEMKGKTSLKAVLPAIWNNHPELHEIPWLKKYVRHDGLQVVLDPYSVLGEIEIAGKAEVVKEGTGAMRAYQDMMFGKTRDDAATKAKWRQLLLQYCELDTIAMLVVWTYWNRAVGTDHLEHRSLPS